MNRRIRRIAFTASAVTALLLPLSAAPASAAPTNCWVEHGAVVQYAYGNCSSGTGTFAIWVQCHNIWYNQWTGYVTRSTRWHTPDILPSAQVFCVPGLETLTNYGMWRRN